MARTKTPKAIYNHVRRILAAVPAVRPHDWTRRQADPPAGGDQAARGENVMANQATIDKLAATNPSAMEFDASVDAIRFLQMSPEMPLPTIHWDHSFDRHLIVLNWQDRSRLVWARAWFDGSGLFGWLNLCPPEQFEEPPTDDYKNVSVDRGAPATLVSRIDFVMRGAS
jgi:hypothetical protein